MPSAFFSPAHIGVNALPSTASSLCLFGSAIVRDRFRNHPCEMEVEGDLAQHLIACRIKTRTPQVPNRTFCSSLPRLPCFRLFIISTNILSDSKP